MSTERILVIIGSIGGVLGGVWAIDAWILPRVIPGFNLLIGSHPWIVWLALIVFVGSLAFWIGLRIERKGKPPSSGDQPPPIIPHIPQGARKVETVVDYPRPGATRTTVTVDYLDGLPNTPDLQRRNLFQKASGLFSNNKYEEAIPLFRELLARPYSPDEEIALQIFIGNCFAHLSQFEEAINHYKKAMHKARKHADAAGEATALTNLGAVYDTKGMLGKALEYQQKALMTNREIDNPMGEAINLGNIGIVYQIKGELDKALEHHQKALKINREIGYREGEASSLGNIGIVYKTKGELDKALEHYQQALKMYRKMGHREGQARGLSNIGNVYQIRGEIDKALEQYQQALKIFEDIGARREAETVKNLINNLIQKE